MTLVAFVSGRSPGLTTAIHALAATWPEHRRAIVAEFDPAGGSLAARHELPAEPGLTNLAAAGRRGLNPETVLRHCRRLPSGVISLVAPVSPDRVASALAVLGAELAQTLDSIPGTDVLADCGRIEQRSPALDLVRAAPYAVFVVTPSLEGVAQAQARLESLALSPGRVALVTIGERPYRPAEVGAALHLPVLGALAHDPAGVARLNAGQMPRRGDLRRSAAAISRDLVGVLPPVGPPFAEPLTPSPVRNHPPVRDRPPARNRKPAASDDRPAEDHRPTGSYLPAASALPWSPALAPHRDHPMASAFRPPPDLPRSPDLAPNHDEPPARVPGRSQAGEPAHVPPTYQTHVPGPSQAREPAHVPGPSPVHKPPADSPGLPARRPRRRKPGPVEGATVPTAGP